MSAALILALAGAARAAECVPADPGAAASAAAELVIEDELDAATRLAWEGLNALECLEQVPHPQDLATLWQVLGAIEIYRGEHLLADQHLARSAAVHPGWFDDRLGQEVQDAWARASVAVVESAGLSVWPVPEGATLYLNGVARPNAPAAAAPGRHVVQVLQDDALVYSLVVELAEEQHAEIATGLAPPPVARRGPSPWLVGAGVVALAAAGSYTAAAQMHGRLPEHTTVDALDEDYFTGRAVGYQLAGGLAGAAALGVGLHVALW